LTFAPWFCFTILIIQTKRFASCMVMLLHPDFDWHLWLR
jgi:hypothetical protein